MILRSFIYLLTLTIRCRSLTVIIVSLIQAILIPSRDKNKRLDNNSSNDIAAIPKTSGVVQEIIDWFRTKVITLWITLTIMNHLAPERSIPAPVSSTLVDIFNND